MRLLTLPLVLALCLAAAGCGDGVSGSDGDAGGDGSGTSGGATPGADAPADGTYVATEVSGHSLVEGTSLRLTWEGESLSADAGCNGMSGQARVADGRLSVGGLAMTEMGCEPGRMEQDQWVADLLTSGPEIAATDDGFTLTGATATVRFATEPAPDAVPLEGTTWRLESVVDGDVASSSVGGPDDATPRVRITQGQVVGFDGCNDLSGPVEVTGDRITAGDDLVTTLKACDPAQPPPDLAGLLRGSTYVVEGDRLTLTRGEVSLVFRAG